MSLSVDGVWKVGVWAQTVWADGVWFEGARAAVIAAIGGGKSRRKKYPRRIMVHGRLYNARNANEEREILRTALERAKILVELEEPAKAEAIKQSTIQIVKRLKQVDNTEAQWLQRLREIDEELLLLI